MVFMIAMTICNHDGECYDFCGIVRAWFDTRMKINHFIYGIEALGNPKMNAT